MTDDNRPSFDEYVETLSEVATPVAAVPDDEREKITSAATAIAALDEVTADTVTALVSEHPEWVPVLGMAVGLSQEGLKRQLKFVLGSDNWMKLAGEKPADVVKTLQRFDLVEQLEENRHGQFTFADVLIARAAGRTRAGSAIKRGRKLEDKVEAVVAELGLPYKLRSRFEGRGRASAPCDIAIPDDGEAAMIACAVKGFDSTGSKLTDAVREIEEMATVRRPNQYVLAVVDGIGWLGRMNDLRRIHELWASNRIDGLYTQQTFDAFDEDLSRAAIRLGLV